jgi:3-hydroxy-3-methylglutaryl CoA synthase
VYSPTQNRIYLAPYGQGNQTNWHYIDCSTGSVIAYAHGVTAVSNAYNGGVYSPTQNRIYLAPYGQGNQTNWHYIDDYDDLAVPISKTLMAGALFNKF